MLPSYTVYTTKNVKENNNCHKNEIIWFHSAVMHCKDAHGMVNSGDPDETAHLGAERSTLIRVCSVS